MHTLRKLLRELHHRSVWQVLGLYLAGSWGVLQAVDFLTGFAGLPGWTPSFALVLLLVGLPVVLATAFVQRGVGGWRYDPHEEIDPNDVVGRTPAEVLVVPRPELFTWRNAFVAAMASAALLVGSVAAYLATWSLGIGPMGSLLAQGVIEERDPVILAEFENRTGDVALGAAVTEAFRVDLLESRVVTLVDGALVGEALARMGRTPDEPLTPAIAREVAVREGITAVVEGEIARVGAGYLLAARIVVPEDGRSAAAFRETAGGDEGLLAAIDRLSQRVREKAGESLRTVRAGQPLEAVTTASLDALRRFAQANRIEEDGDIEGAIDLLEEAVALDPAFAMAWRKLAVLYGNRGGDRSAAVDAATRAYENRDRLTERERLLAEAHYHYAVTGDQEQVARAYRRVLEGHPDESVALNNLALVHLGRGEWAQAAELLERAVSGPGRSRSAFNNLITCLYNLGRKEEALGVLVRWEELYPPDFSYYRQRAGVHWGMGDPEAARAAVLEGLERLDADPFGRVQLLQGLGAIAFAEGRVRQAQAHLLEGISIAERQGALGLAAAMRATQSELVLAAAATDVARELQGLERYAEEHFAELPALNRPYGALGSYWAVYGRDADRAEYWWGRLRSEAPETVVDTRAWETDEIGRRMWISVLRGRPADALADLRELERRQGCAHCTLQEAATIFEALEEPDSAIAALERFVTTDDFEFLVRQQVGLGQVLPWLAELYERAGRRDDARAAWMRFADRWAAADDVLQPRVRAARERASALAREAG